MNPLDLIKQVRGLGYNVGSPGDGELSVEPFNCQDVYPIPPDTLDKIESMKPELLAILHREGWLVELVYRIGASRGYSEDEQDALALNALDEQPESCSHYAIEAQFLCEKFGDYLPHVLLGEDE